jgi:GntR family transcriptional regulator/MocR family aminotransferase
VLYPGLKLGYLVVPKLLVAAFKRAHYDLNRPGQMAQQAALAEFIEMGHFASCLRRARLAYAERRQALIGALAPLLHPSTGASTAFPPEKMAWLAGAAQGLHLCMRLPEHTRPNDQALSRLLAQQGLIARPLSAYCLDRTDLQGLVIGYGYASLSQIKHHGPRLVQTLVDARSGF